jgi:hypothetical protein
MRISTLASSSSAAASSAAAALLRREFAKKRLSVSDTLAGVVERRQ